MKKLLILLLGLFVIESVHAQVYKCMETHGGYRFSDIPCKETEKTEVVHDRAAGILDEEQQKARQRIEKMQEEIVAGEKEEDAGIARRQKEQKREEEEKAGKKERAVEDAKRAEAISDCMRDIERRGASQDVKAEMIAACRSAGISGISADSVRECVRNIERTSASEKEKARQIAICHGADVEQRPYPHRHRSR